MPHTGPCRGEHGMSRLEQLEQMLAREPDDVFLNFALAMELAKAGRHDESLARFDRVLALNADYVAAHFHKAKTLLLLGDDAGARAELGRGIDRAGSCGDLHAKGEMEELLASL